jgi:hypothetical protein
LYSVIRNRDKRAVSKQIVSEEEDKEMKSIITKLVAAVLLVALCITTFNITSFAYSEVPDYFDFGESTLSMDAGTSRTVWVRSNYKYSAFVGPHTSKKTYIDCTEKAGSEYVTLYIGPDETEKNVFFYFYVNDKEVENTDIHDCIEVYVQNIDYSYQQRAEEAAALKYYANNNAEFNAYYYYMNYEDLRNAFGTNGDALYNHFYTSGKAEGRVGNRLFY